jgi:integrase
LKRVFKWGVSEELIKPEVLVGLQSVAGLKRGRSAAYETEPVKPVAQHIVDQTLPYLTKPVAAMVRLQLLTGMRPGEVCAMRGCDLDMSGDVWLYRPPHHKGAYRGLDRVICLGPQAQEIVREFLKLDTQAHLFTPIDSMSDFRARQRAARKTPVQPSQESRAKRKPKRTAGDRYDTQAYGHAVAKACDFAFPPPAELARLPRESKAAWFARLKPDGVAKLKAWQSANRWYPNRLRHAHGTDVRKMFGLEAAQVALGHKDAQITQVYAERDLELARKVALKIG